MNFAFRKFFILIIVAVFAVGAGLFLKARFFRNDAGALAQTTCAPLTYATGKNSTVGVPFNGVENSGTLDFTQADDALKACAYQGTSGLNIKGLVWNTNLGWINFEETGNYATAVNSTDGTFSGKAYGDNIGYIQMDGVRVAIADGEDSGQWCGGALNKGDLYGYAWTDTVGWMNFCGAHVDLSALETPAADTPPPDTGSTPPPTDTTTPPTDTGTPAEEEPGQVAMVQGNVSINIVDTTGLPGGGKISMSLGEQAQSQRENFYRAVKKSTKENFTPIETKRISNITEGAFYYSSSAKTSNNVKKPCTIIFSDTSDTSDTLEIGRDSTIVSKGCNIFIDSNLTAKAGTTFRLGIIALADLTIPDEQKGGNIYICGNVTDIETNLLADGALMSYGDVTNSDCGDTMDKSPMINTSTGYPLFGYKDFAEAVFNITQIKNFLKNQLTIFGSLISNNTYGGSVSTKDTPVYTLGDGSTATDQNSARLFDINFLRYAKTEPKPDSSWGELCWASYVGLSKYFGATDPCDSANNPDVTSIVNIIYRAPTNKMPVFNAVK